MLRAPKWITAKPEKNYGWKELNEFKITYTNDSNAIIGSLLNDGF